MSRYMNLVYKYYSPQLWSGMSQLLSARPYPSWLASGLESAAVLQQELRLTGVTALAVMVGQEFQGFRRPLQS
jgi:hypothetical protein